VFVCCLIRWKIPRILPSCITSRQPVKVRSNETIGRLPQSHSPPLFHRCVRGQGNLVLTALSIAERFIILEGNMPYRMLIVRCSFAVVMREDKQTMNLAHGRSQCSRCASWLLSSCTAGG
jgi:hypothetical protein